MKRGGRALRRVWRRLRRPTLGRLVALSLALHALGLGLAVWLIAPGTGALRPEPAPLIVDLPPAEPGRPAVRPETPTRSARPAPAPSSSPPPPRIAARPAEPPAPEASSPPVIARPVEPPAAPPPPPATPPPVAPAPPVPPVVVEPPPPPAPPSVAAKPEPAPAPAPAPAAPTPEPAPSPPPPAPVETPPVTAPPVVSPAPPPVSPPPAVAARPPAPALPPAPPASPARPAPAPPADATARPASPAPAPPAQPAPRDTPSEAPFGGRAFSLLRPKIDVPPLPGPRSPGGSAAEGEGTGREPGSAPEGGEAIPLNTPDPRYADYFPEIKKRIQDHWVYPTEAARKHQAGQLVLEFVIRKDGRVPIVDVVRSSGFELLDRYALNAVRLAAPFPAIPADFRTDEIRISASFTYILDHGFKIFGLR